MATVLLIGSFIAGLAGLISWVMLLIAAFDDEPWKALVGFAVWPYLLYWAIAEYYDEGKWARIGAWVGGKVLAVVLIVYYIFAALPPGKR